MLGAIEQQFSLQPQEVSQVFAYFRELLGTFAKPTLPEGIPRRSVMASSVAPWSGDGEVGDVASAGVATDEGAAADTWYEGEWSEDGSKPHGQGTYRWADGTTLTGEWAEGKPHGAARMERADGCWYDGTFADGKAVGAGETRRLLPNGTVYWGAVLDGVAHGQGTRRTASGA